MNPRCKPHGPLGRTIHRLRVRAGLTQSELARSAGLAVSHVAYLERGLRPNPRWSTIACIAAALGVSVSEIAAMQLKESTRSIKAWKGARRNAT